MAVCYLAEYRINPVLILVSFMQKHAGMIYLAGIIVFVILLTAMCIPAIVTLGRVEKHMKISMI